MLAFGMLARESDGHFADPWKRTVFDAEDRRIPDRTTGRKDFLPGTSNSQYEEFVI